MNYKVTNKTSGNSQKLNQEQYDRFFDNNTKYDYRVYNMKSLKRSRCYTKIGYGLISLGLMGFTLLQLLKVIN